MKIWQLLFSGLFFSLLIACSGKQEKIPDDVLTPAEMVPLLVDLHIAQSAVAVFQYSDTIRYNNNELSVLILKKRNIVPEKYLKSLHYYSAHPEVMSEIYQEVINELNKSQGMEGKAGR
ncbi:MAG TPA: DUF4296 domain-containing protein [Bacteroidia bacterium]|nr:DUF4296 domain-containing protein [Bacteroidia bacterium]